MLSISTFAASILGSMMAWKTSGLFCFRKHHFYHREQPQVTLSFLISALVLVYLML
jgi:hypothetical protein